MVEIERRPAGYLLVRIDGEVDLGTDLPSVEAFGAEDDTGPVVVDLRDVCFFSLGGVDWVNTTMTGLTARGRPVRIVCTRGGACGGSWVC